jgi:hypothetical protein
MALPSAVGDIQPNAGHSTRFPAYVHPRITMCQYEHHAHDFLFARRAFQASAFAVVN